MKNILVASNNKHKIDEIKQILKDFPVRIISLKEAGIDVDVEETGTTFRENAYIKAKAIFDMLEIKKDFMVMSDDSGLAVDYLDGAPGVYSARFSGEHGDTKQNNEKLLKLMEGVPREKRTASFICSIVLICDDGKVIDAEGQVKGYITEDLSGTDGFGYDPLFYVEDFGKTFAEVSADEKNSISHRGRALKILKDELSKYIQ